MRWEGREREREGGKGWRELGEKERKRGLGVAWR